MVLPLIVALVLSADAKEVDRPLPRTYGAVAFIAAGALMPPLPLPPGVVRTCGLCPISAFGGGAGVMGELGTIWNDSLVLAAHASVATVIFFNFFELGAEFVLALSDHLGFGTGARVGWLLSLGFDVASPLTVMVPARLQWTFGDRTRVGRRGFTVFAEVGGGFGFLGVPFGPAYSATIGLGHAAW